MSKQTPEGKVKNHLAAYLVSIGCVPASHASEATFADTGWFFLPVPSGFGVGGIPDVLGHYKGKFFGIEVKAPERIGHPNRGMTPGQVLQGNAISKTGGYAMVFDGGEDDWHALKEWVNAA